MKYKLCIFLSSILWLVPNYGKAQDKGDHLEPVEDVFNLAEWHAEYFSSIRNLLFEQKLSEARIRILSLPAFGKESLLEVAWDQSEEIGFIKKRVPQQRIWQHEDPNSIRVIEYEREINCRDFDLLYDLILRSVSKTRYQEEGGIGLDGYSVYFMIWKGGFGWKAGQTWSPRDGTKMKRLVDIYLELSKQIREENSPLIFPDILVDKIKNLKKEFE